MTARSALRDATSADHARVDDLFGALDLSQAGDYRLFLSAQAEAFLPIEAELDRQHAERILSDWPARRRSALLRADLSDLGLPEPASVAIPGLDHTSAQLGAIYVLEGSRLGGAFLKRKLAPDFPHRFVSAPQPPGAWRKLLELLDENLYGSERIGAAVGAARAVFEYFEAAGRRHLESIRHERQLPRGQSH